MTIKELREDYTHGYDNEELTAFSEGEHSAKTYKESRETIANPYGYGTKKYNAWINGWYFALDA